MHLLGATTEGRIDRMASSRVAALTGQGDDLATHGLRWSVLTCQFRVNGEERRLCECSAANRTQVVLRRPCIPLNGGCPAVEQLQPLSLCFRQLTHVFLPVEHT
jgi:hypothetical protein